ncbi:MAG: glycosyltransferase family 9 protein [Candidatus Omnitrophota bacterium]|nr:glycosyltransferase family 9 protein [Candidatus Omnitrophota bacterium]
MPKNYSISAVVLSKNSEKKIGDCLKSLTGWADEIIIVDGESTDNTAKIVESFNAKVYPHKFLGEFSAERNFGSDKASSQWVLQLDSDEVITDDFKQKCDLILPATNYNAFKFRRKNIFLGHAFTYGGWYHWSQHLFRKNKARYEGRVHEKMIVDGDVGHLDADIMHTPFDSISEFIDRQNRYTDLQARDIIDTEKDLSIRNIKYNLRAKPAKLFKKMYIKNKGYKEGLYGFVFAILFSWVHFLKWAKVWELVKDRKNILVMRNDRFGEFLLNIPAIRALKEKFPASKIILAVDNHVKEIAAKIPNVDEVIVWKSGKHSMVDILKFSGLLKKKSIDIVFVMNPSKDSNIAVKIAGIPERIGYAHKWDFLLTKKIEDRKYLAQKHEIEYNLDLVRIVGADTKDKSLSLKINETELRCCGAMPISRDFTAAVGLIVIHPWTSDAIKQWPVERFRELALKLVKEFNLDVVIVGGKDEIEKSASFNYINDRILNLTGKTTLPQLAAILKKSGLLISGDSGPVHLACSVGTPVIALFRNDMPGKGPKRWGPWGSGNIVIEKNNLSDISVEEVLDKVREWKNSSSSILSV